MRLHYLLCVLKLIPPIQQVLLCIVTERVMLIELRFQEL